MLGVEQVIKTSSGSRQSRVKNASQRTPTVARVVRHKYTVLFRDAVDTCRCRQSLNARGKCDRNHASFIINTMRLTAVCIVAGHLTH